MFFEITIFPPYRYPVMLFFVKEKKDIKHHISERPSFSLPSCFPDPNACEFFPILFPFPPLSFPSLSSFFGLPVWLSFWKWSCHSVGKLFADWKIKECRVDFCFVIMLVYKDSFIVLPLKSSDCFIALVKLPLSLLSLSVCLWISHSSEVECKHT